MSDWAGVRAVILGVVGGYVDAVGYLMLRGLFPNHVTGNLPLAAADPGWTAVPALLMVPLWLAAVVAAGRFGRRGGIAALLAAEAGLLGLFLLAGVTLEGSTLVTQAIVAGAGVCAMATQSVVSRLGGYAYPTTMVTGTLTLLGMDLAAGEAEARPRVLALGRVVVAFAAGAGAGGLLAAHVGFWALVVPVVAVAQCARHEGRVRDRTAPRRP
jgi:uncharacterized membrane protein YoaK (UPF0700 family)